MKRLARSLKRRSADQGAAAVEFALVSLVLLTMLIGILEFGRLWAVQGNLAQATRDAARTYAITDDPATVEPSVIANFSWLTPGTQDSLTVTPSSSGDAGAGDLNCRRTVTSSYRVDSLTGFLGDGWNITVDGSMRCNG